MGHSISYILLVWGSMTSEGHAVWGLGYRVNEMG